MRNKSYENGKQQNLMVIAYFYICTAFFLIQKGCNLLKYMGWCGLLLM